MLGALGLAHFVVDRTHPSTPGVAARVHAGLLGLGRRVVRDASPASGYGPARPPVPALLPGGAGADPRAGLAARARRRPRPRAAGQRGGARGRHGHALRPGPPRDRLERAVARRAAVDPQPPAGRLRPRHGLRRVAPARLRPRLLPGPAPAPGRRRRPARTGRRRRPARVRRRADPAPRRAPRPGRRGRAGALVAAAGAVRAGGRDRPPSSPRSSGWPRSSPGPKHDRRRLVGSRCGSSSRARTTAGLSDPFVHALRRRQGGAAPPRRHGPARPVGAAGPGHAARLLAPPARPLHPLRGRGAGHGRRRLQPRLVRALRPERLPTLDRGRPPPHRDAARADRPGAARRRVWPAYALLAFLNISVP